MTKLDPLIALFVQEVLKALRQATLTEISELFSQPARPAATPRTVARPRGRRPRAAVEKARVPAPAVRERRTPRKPAASEPRIGAEITDPDALLSAAARPAVAPSPLTHRRSVASAPSGAEQLATEGAPSLRAGETLVRTTGAGLVIRRVKRG